MPDFTTIGGNAGSWGAEHAASARLADVGQKQSEYKIGGRFGGSDIRIRTGARVTRARGVGVWFRRLGSGIQDAFVREKDIGLIKKSSQAAIDRKQARILRHAEHAFDKSVNRLVEDLANFGNSMTESELANHLSNIHQKMVELHAAGQAAGDDRSEPEHLMERLRNTLVDSLTVVATASPEKANLIRQQFEPGGRLAGVGKNFGLIVPQEDLATKSDGALFFNALKDAASGAIGRKDDLNTLYHAGVTSMSDVQMSHALNERQYPTLAAEFLAYADKEEAGNNVRADRLLSQIYAPKGDHVHIEVVEQDHQRPAIKELKKRHEQQLRHDLQQLRDRYLDQSSPHTINVSGEYRRKAILEINRYLDGNGDLQKLVNALDAVKVDNRNRISDTYDRFQQQLEPKWGKPRSITGKQIAGPKNLELSGPSDVSLEHRTTRMLKDLPSSAVDRGLSQSFRGDVERRSRPVLVDTSGQKTILEPQNIGNVDPYRQFTDFVDDEDPNVAKNLSQYINQNAVKNSISLLTLGIRDRKGNTVIASLDEQRLSYTVQKDGRGGFFVKYNATPGLNSLVARDENNDQTILMLDQEQNYLQLNMTIHLSREDLAAGNGNFTYVDKPTWNAKWQE